MANLAEQGGQPPWLRRHIEAQQLLETVKMLKKTHIYTADEIVKIVGERYKRLRPRRRGLQGRIEFEAKRLEVVYQVAVSRIRGAAGMPQPARLSSFHRSLIDAFVGIEAYVKALREIRKAVNVMRSIWKDYHVLIVSSQSAAEAARLRREGSGRILSVVRRNARNLLLLRRVREELLKTHVIAEGLPVVVVAGVPSTGKSTLVKALSTAEPEIAEYPFTTKKIIVGKVTSTVPHFFLVDTPGVLERLRSMHNEIERKALAALETLPDVVLFIIDPSEQRIQAVEEQAALLKDIATSMISGKERGIVLVVNKVDAVSRAEALGAAEAALAAIREAGASRNLCGGPVYTSAIHGKGLEELKGTIVRCLRRYAPWLFV